MNSGNPWVNLPKNPPFILPQDKSVAEVHRSYAHLRLETLPEPFIGRLINAEVVFLALNPGFAQSDVDSNMCSKRFIAAVENNLSDTPDASFYYFAGGLEFTGGYTWWKTKLKPLLLDGISERTLAQKIMCIEYFPYHSVTYKAIKDALPSQHYSFSLVEQAIDLKKIIIVMRSKKLWQEAVPKLRVYPFMTLSSPQNVVISARNLGETNYQKVLQLLR